MDQALRSLAHAQLRFNAPLSEQHAASLVRRLALAPGHHVLDLGCGFGELLLSLVAAHPAATGTGVDTDREALDRARRSAAEQGLQERVEFSEGDVATFAGHGHLVLCVGASHAWGGTAAALQALHDHVEPGGVALFGAGVWEQEPREDAVRLLGEHGSLDALLAAAHEAGYEVEGVELSSRDEWDDFEAGWRAGLEESRDAAAQELASRRRHEYEDVYRGVLGFAWLVLRPR